MHRFVPPSLTRHIAFGLANGGALTGAGAAGSAPFTSGAWPFNDGMPGMIDGLSDQTILAVEGG